MRQANIEKDTETDRQTGDRHKAFKLLRRLKFQKYEGSDKKNKPKKREKIAQIERRMDEKEELVDKDKMGVIMSFV